MSDGYQVEVSGSFKDLDSWESLVANAPQFVDRASSLHFLKVRIWLATQFFKAAAFILGCGIEINSIERIDPVGLIRQEGRVAP